MDSWQIVRLRAQNFFSFGSASLDCSYDTKYLVTGNNLDDVGADSNGSGKSAFCDVVAWALFGKTPRTDSIEDIIRTGTDSVSVRLVLHKGHWEGLGESAGSASPVVVINRYREIDGKHKLSFTCDGEDLSLRTPTLTQKAINRFFDYDEKSGFSDYLSQVYFSNTASKGFLSSDAGPLERQAVLERFLGLSIFDVAKGLANDDSKKSLQALEVLKGRIESEDKLLKEYPTLEKLQADIAEADDKELSYEKQIGTIKGLISTAKDVLHRYDTQKARIVHVMQALREAEAYSKQVVSQFQELEEKMGTVTELKKQWDEKGSKDYSSALEEFASSQTLNIRLTSEVQESKDVARIAHELNIACEHDLEDLQLKIDDCPNCPSCDESLMVVGINTVQKLDVDNLRSQLMMLELKKNRLKKESDVAKENWDVLQLSLDSCLENFSTLSKQLKSLGVVKSQIESVDFSAHEKLKSDIITAGINVEHAQKTEIEYRGEAVINLMEVSACYQSLVLLRVAEFIEIPAESLRDTSDVDLPKCVTKLENDLSVHDHQLSRLRQERFSWLEQVGRVKGLTVTINEYKKEGRDLYFASKDSAYWGNKFPEIKRKLLSDFVPLFEATVNKYLSYLEVDERVEFSLVNTSKKGNTRPGFSIVVYDGTSKRSFETFSGGEKSRILISVGFALVELSSLQNSNGFGFLFCDELLDDIDETGMEYFFKMIDSVPGQKFMITHAKSSLARSRVDRVVTVTKENGVSSIA